MAQEIFKDLAEDARNNYNKKHWLEVEGLLVKRRTLNKFICPQRSGIQYNN